MVLRLVRHCKQQHHRHRRVFWFSPRTARRLLGHGCFPLCRVSPVRQRPVLPRRWLRFPCCAFSQLALAGSVRKLLKSSASAEVRVRAAYSLMPTAEPYRVNRKISCKAQKCLANLFYRYGSTGSHKDCERTSCRTFFLDFYVILILYCFDEKASWWYIRKRKYPTPSVVSAIWL